jgi:hypothetical protein
MPSQGLPTGVQLPSGCKLHLAVYVCAVVSSFEGGGAGPQAVLLKAEELAHHHPASPFNFASSWDNCGCVTDAQQASTCTAHTS